MSPDDSLKGDKPSIEKAWEYYNTYTLPRRILVSTSVLIHVFLVPKGITGQKIRVKNHRGYTFSASSILHPTIVLF